MKNLVFKFPAIFGWLVLMHETAPKQQTHKTTNWVVSVICSYLWNFEFTGRRDLYDVPKGPFSDEAGEDEILVTVYEIFCLGWSFFQQCKLNGKMSNSAEEEKNFWQTSLFS